MLKQLVSAPSISAAGGAQGGKGGHTQDIVPTAGVCMCACVCMSDRVSVCKCFVVQVYVCVFVRVLTPHTCKGVLRSILVQGNKPPSCSRMPVCVCACVFACSFCTFINIHIHTHTRIYRDHWNRVQRRQSPRHLAHVPFASAAPQSIRFQHKRTIQGGLSGECECVSVNECVHRIALNTQYCCRL
jgi:hypothetical protein